MLEYFDPEKHGSKARVRLCEAEGLLPCEMLREKLIKLRMGSKLCRTLSAFVRMLGKPVFSVGPTEPEREELGLSHTLRSRQRCAYSLWAQTV